MLRKPSHLKFFLENVSVPLICSIGIMITVFDILARWFKTAPLCTTSSCEAVSESSLLPGSIMSFLGFLYFLLMIYSFIRKRSHLMILLASIGLSTEAVLIGRQLIDFKLICHYCITVGGLIVVASIIVCERVKSYLPLVSALSVAIAMYITPAWVAPLNKIAVDAAGKIKDESRILVYSPDCPHCKEVLKFCESKGIDLSLCPKKRAISLLRVMGIKGVPVLVVNKGPKKLVLVGSQAIIDYLRNTMTNETPRGIRNIFSPNNISDGILEPEGVCTSTGNKTNCD